MFGSPLARDFSGPSWWQHLYGVAAARCAGWRLRVEEAKATPAEPGARHHSSYRASRRNHARRNGLVWRQQRMIARNGVYFVAV